MNSIKQTTEEDKTLMAQYEITQDLKPVYFYKGHKYEKLSDAVSYAKHNLARTQTTASSSTD